MNEFELIARLIGGAVPFLRPGGHLLVETGRGQARRAQALFGADWEGKTAFKDLRGICRVVGARKRA